MTHYISKYFIHQRGNQLIRGKLSSLPRIYCLLLFLHIIYWFIEIIPTERWQNKMNCELMLTYDTPALRQTGSRNLTKNVHISSMCIKTNKVGKQEVGIWRVQKHYPQYGIPIWCLWPNIRFLPSTVTEKNVTKKILDGRKDGQT
jgi:hypothetical protein